MLAESVFFLVDRRDTVRCIVKAIALTAVVAAVFVGTALLAPIVLAALGAVLAQVTAVAVGCCVAAFPVLKVLVCVVAIPFAMKAAAMGADVAVKFEMKGRK